MRAWMLRCRKLAKVIDTMQNENQMRVIVGMVHKSNNVLISEYYINWSRSVRDMNIMKQHQRSDLRIDMVFFFQTNVKAEKFSVTE